MPKPVWILEETVAAIHNRQISEHGGLPGVRDTGALASALERPRQKHACGKPDNFELAAAYTYGLSVNHPFHDGNKRTAYVTSLLFLRLNGYAIKATDEDKFRTFLALAAGEMSEPDLAIWFRDHAVTA